MKIELQFWLLQRLVLLRHKIASVRKFFELRKFFPYEDF